MKPSVSLITVTQFKRQDAIVLLCDCINSQTYKNIIEWVIVEGSKTPENCEANGEFIKTLGALVPKVAIKYIAPGHTVQLGELRNIGNRACTGDVICSFDDDDFVMKTRVEHSVQVLKGKYLIAGCSAKYMYDYNLQKLLKFSSFGPGHSTNDCMAFKKEYLLENSHDPLAAHAEESSFTKNFTNPMAQLDPTMCIVSSSHSQNTFSKKEIVIKACLLANPMDPNSGSLYPKSEKTEKVVTDFVPQATLERYTKIFDVPVPSPYDIVYYTGGTSINWDPAGTSLGGSEQAVMHLATEWARMGKKVAVYGNVPNVVHQGVEYFEWTKFSWMTEYNTVILWRSSGINCSLQFPIRAKKLIADFHDTVQSFRFDYKKYEHKIDTLMFKSKFHVESYEKQFGPLLKSRVAIIPNGVRVESFSTKPLGERNPYRFCYCSCYTRGLEEILRYIWPKVFANEPRAELHLYYGMYGVQDENFKQMMTFFMGQQGVMDHGRQGLDFIIREKWLSTFHLYITDTESEIDCISIRESVAAGCIPLIGKTGVFKERDGIHFTLEKTPQGYDKIANGILQLLQNPYILKKVNIPPEVTSWEKVAALWLPHFHGNNHP